MDTVVDLTCSCLAPDRYFVADLIVAVPRYAALTRGTENCSTRLEHGRAFRARLKKKEVSASNISIREYTKESWA